MTALKGHAFRGSFGAKMFKMSTKSKKNLNTCLKKSGDICLERSFIDKEV